MFEPEAAKGDGVIVEWRRKMIAAVAAVGKWKSLVCGISKRSGKPAFGFRALPLKCAGHVGPLL